jgi:hypothetical protein
LIGLDWMTVCGERLPVYTKTIERYADLPDRRRWCVVGDQVTLRVAETQTMHRDIEHYRRGGAGAGGIAYPVTDVLEAAVDVRVARNAGLVKVFGDESHGQPYELAILGAAMVVESHAPLGAMISGYVERKLAEAAQRFAESTLQMPVSLPVRIDGPRLAQRLGRFIEGDAIGPMLERLRIDTPPAVATVRGKTKPAPQPGIEELLILPSADDLSPQLREEVHRLAFAVRRLQARIHDRSARASVQRPSVGVGPLAILENGDASALRHALAQALSDHGPTLTLDAWNRIAREDDMDMLRFLLTMVLLVRESWASLFLLQRAMLENEALCRYAVEASRNDALMSQLAERWSPASRRP